ncbi:hypothetical protein Agub_g32 [Astrephomene gubernaculifera]|uniref:OTU domain-containing protein n=1 Tax=Astrephomene gubernaculifera TaxID=47775 RepID=A0AAD3DET1_9CHLO|nr:hypothetical protein Agub_g32 [Astrephomene gubernaculifera]
MGRRGMKSFLKGAHKQHGSDDEAADAAPEQPSTSAPKAPASQSAQPPKAADPQPVKAADAHDADDSDDDEEGGSKGPETRGKMLQRHKREMAAHKKTVQKLGSKKKDEAARLTAEMEARHARELAELEQREQQQQQQAAGGAGGEAAASAAAAGEQLAGLELAAEAGAEHKKPSKAQKRREKLAQQEAERAARIASEQAALGPSDKAVEEAQLRALLRPHGLGIREIRADGHCLYRAIEDQLTQHAQQAPTSSSSSTSVPDYQTLRRLAAAHIRSHADDFLPFVYDEDAAGGPAEQLEEYCEELEGSAVWGGQLELGALAQALRRQIKVYATGMPLVSLGDEHAGAGGAVQLCYLRHAFGLGEHYNSVEPLVGGAEEEEGKEEGER